MDSDRTFEAGQSELDSIAAVSVLSLQFPICRLCSLALEMLGVPQPNRMSNVGQCSSTQEARMAVNGKLLIGQMERRNGFRSHSRGSRR